MGTTERRGGGDSQEAVLPVEYLCNAAEDHDHADDEVGQAEDVCELGHDGGGDAELSWAKNGRGAGGDEAMGA